VIFPILQTEARGILSNTTGFIRSAGFTHSLTPARNCTFGCSYCYVPTMGIYGGLKSEDSRHWGQFTTFKSNAAALLRKELRPDQRIYCSPVVDPYQPAEEQERMMPAILDTLIRNPPNVFTIQTRGPLILRDLDPIKELSLRTCLHVSFSVPTDDETIRRIYEGRCAPFDERLRVLQTLIDANIRTFPTIAPILPCNPEHLAQSLLEVTRSGIICDPFHVRATKPHGATTRDAAWRIAERHGHQQWFDPTFQATTVDRIGKVVKAAGRRFGIGWEAFSWLAECKVR